MMEEPLWQNAQNVEQKLAHRKRNGLWLVDLTKVARRCNLKSGFSIVQNATNHSVLS